MTPSSDIEARHRLRLAVGNGLQADVWEKFRDRFAIPQILEDACSDRGGPIALQSGR